MGSWEVATDHSRWTLARRIASTRQVQEVMVDFWSNLLNVSLYHDEAIYWRMDYDRVIRAHALTTFESLLQAAITHPSMGLYLDNAISSKEAPNENLGREVLELHTVGVDAGYTEDDVKASLDCSPATESISGGRRSARSTTPSGTTPSRCR